jgi:hypothetical protein
VHHPVLFGKPFLYFIAGFMPGMQIRVPRIAMMMTGAQHNDQKEREKNTLRHGF